MNDCTPLLLLIRNKTIAMINDIRVATIAGLDPTKRLAAYAAEVQANLRKLTSKEDERPAEPNPSTRDRVVINVMSPAECEKFAAQLLQKITDHKTAGASGVDQVAGVEVPHVAFGKSQPETRDEVPSFVAQGAGEEVDACLQRMSAAAQADLDQISQENVTGIGTIASEHDEAMELLKLSLNHVSHHALASLEAAFVISCYRSCRAAVAECNKAG